MRAKCACSQTEQQTGLEGNNLAIEMTHVAR